MNFPSQFNSSSAYTSNQYSISTDTSRVIGASTGGNVTDVYINIIEATHVPYPKDEWSHSDNPDKYTKKSATKIPGQEFYTNEFSARIQHPEDKKETECLSRSSIDQLSLFGQNNPISKFNNLNDPDTINYLKRQLRILQSTGYVLQKREENDELSPPVTPQFFIKD